MKKVDSGSELVNRSGETLAEIVQGIKKVGDIVGDIAAASQEQTLGIEQVNAAVSSIDETTQQNASLAEQTMSSSVAMSERAGDMNQRLDFFSLGDEWGIEQDTYADENKGPEHDVTASDPASEIPATAAGIEDDSEMNQPQSIAQSEQEQPVQSVEMNFDDEEWEEF